MVESASKGLILMYSKESLLKVFEKAHVSPGKRGLRRPKEREGEREREEGAAAALSRSTSLERNHQQTRNGEMKRKY